MTTSGAELSRGSPAPRPPAAEAGRFDRRAINYRDIPVKADIIAGIAHLDVESADCFRELDNYVCSDPGVATLVLRVVNSAFYSRGDKIANIPRAISILGFNVVRSLAMLALSRSLFAQTRNSLFQCHIWQHSLLTALAGQAICAEIGDLRDRDEAFIAGLMHDMGKVLLFSHSQTRYLEVLGLVLSRGCSSIEAEREVFGGDHLEVGREAVVQWKLPARFADFMGVDLCPSDAAWKGDPVLVSLAAANYLTRSNGIGAQPVADIEARKTGLVAFGLNPARCDEWARNEFMANLMDHETYRLCANL